MDFAPAGTVAELGIAPGNTQPLEPPWNLRGLANNAVAWVKVPVGSAQARGGAPRAAMPS
jgi:hypothetical protein